MQNIIPMPIEATFTFTRSSEYFEGTFTALKCSNGLMVIFGNGKFLKQTEADFVISDQVLLPTGVTFNKSWVFNTCLCLVNRNASQVTWLAGDAEYLDRYLKFSVWTENASNITTDIPADILMYGRWK